MAHVMPASTIPVRLRGWRVVLLGLVGWMLSSAFMAHAEEGRVFPDAESVEPLRVGRVIPDVTVRTIDGESVDLAKQIGDRGALLVFYRGGW